MINKLAIVVNSLKPSQDSVDLIQSLNWMADNTNIDVAVFQLEWNKVPVPCCFGIFNISDLYSFGGTVITTNVETTKFAQISPRISSLYLYVQNLDWGKDYDGDYEIYSKTDLIAKNKNDGALLENNWNKSPKMIMEKFNEKSLLELVGEKI